MRGMTPARFVLVTGGNGFLGRRLVGRLLEDGCTVALLQRSADLVDHRIELLCVEHLDPIEIARVLAGRRFDWFFHLATYGVRPDHRDIDTLFRINIEATSALVAIAGTWRPRAVVVAGSGSEYHFEGVSAPVSEDHRLEQYKLYGASKAAATLFATAMATAGRFPFAACRIFGVYGPGEAPHRLLPCLLKGLRQQQRVPLSVGLQQRDFLFVDDVIDALIATALALEAKPQQSIFNVATGRPIEVREFARAVARALKAPESLLGFGDLSMRSDESMIFSGDPARLCALTGWKPSVTLAEGIRRSLEIESAKNHRTYAELPRQSV
jgi:UDP-glucose 4-epimerase